MRTIREAMEEMFREEGIPEGKEMMLIKEAWEKIGGLGRARPIRFHRGRLEVAVSSHAWAQEIIYEIEKIKGGLEEKTGLKIKDIAIKVKCKP